MIDDKNYVSAIILAAGCSSRMGGSITKQQMSILGESVLSRSVRAVCECDLIDEIIVVCRKEEIDWVVRELDNFDKVCVILPGGKSRSESASIGFCATSYDADYIAVHDAARCLITKKNIEDVVRAAFIHGAATASTLVTDTVKRLDSAGHIAETVDRRYLVCAQTPQVFERKIYNEALALYEDSDNTDDVTDDNMLVERCGYKVYPVETGKNNIKITTPEDIGFAEYLLKKTTVPEYRTGCGYDVHRFSEGRKLVLGGVDIPFEKGLLGHSDADVLVHAIMDALLGAASLGDIGRHFPDTDESYNGISSLELLRRVNNLIWERGYSVINIDATIVIQRPKIASYIEEMVHNISKTLNIEQGRVNIKATTEERLGFTGREEGAAAHAIASLLRT